MVKNDGAEIRRQRIHEIGKFVLAQLYKHEEILLSATIAALEYEFGLTKGKLMEYLHILQAVNRFTINYEEDKIMRPSDPPSAPQSTTNNLLDSS